MPGPTYTNTVNYFSHSLGNVLSSLALDGFWILFRALTTESLFSEKLDLKLNFVKPRMRIRPKYPDPMLWIFSVQIAVERLVDLGFFDALTN